jgi:predicted ATP-dependent serine protease
MQIIQHNATENLSSWDMGTKSGGLRAIDEIEIPERFFNRLKFSVPALKSLFDEGLIAGQRITVSAEKGSGKTTFLLTLLMDVVMVNHIKGVYISNEECVEQLAFTAKRLGIKGIMVDNMTDIDDIACMIREQKLKVVVLDSVAGLTCKQFHSDKLMQEYALCTLSKVSQECECVICFIQHYTKSGVAKGSSGWSHAVDTCILIHKMDDEVGAGVRHFEVDKNRFGGGKGGMYRLTDKGFDFENPVAPPADKKDESSYAAAKKQDTSRIMATISNMSLIGGAKLSDFIDLGIDMGRVERLLKELTSSSTVQQFGGGKGQPKDSKRWRIMTSGDPGEEPEIPLDIH